MLWDSGEDGELAATLAYAITYRLGNLHIAELVDRIEPQHPLARQLLARLYHHRWTESKVDNPKSPDAHIRLAVLTAVARLQLQDETTLQFLIDCRKSESDVVRQAAFGQILARRFGNRFSIR